MTSLSMKSYDDVAAQWRHDYDVMAANLASQARVHDLPSQSLPASLAMMMDILSSPSKASYCIVSNSTSNINVALDGIVETVKETNLNLNVEIWDLLKICWDLGLPNWDIFSEVWKKFWRKFFDQNPFVTSSTTTRTTYIMEVDSETKGRRLIHLCHIRSMRGQKGLEDSISLSEFLSSPKREEIGQKISTWKICNGIAGKGYTPG